MRKIIFAAALLACVFLMFSACGNSEKVPDDKGEDEIEEVLPNDEDKEEIDEDDSSDEKDEHNGQSGSKDNDNGEEDSRYTVNFDDYKVSFILPEGWKDKCDITERENSISFYQKASREFGGHVFTFAMEDKDEEPVYPNYEVIYDDGSAQLLVVYPTDVQFSEEAVEEYTQLSDQVPDILETVEVEKQ